MFQNHLPSLVKTYRIQEKVKGVGLIGTIKSQVWDKFIEEINELQYEVLRG